MICFNCGRKLKKGYFYNGVAYGPECFKKLGFKLNGKGQITRLRLPIEKKEENELQGSLF